MSTQSFRFQFATDRPSNRSLFMPHHTLTVTQQLVKKKLENPELWLTMNKKTSIAGEHYFAFAFRCGQPTKVTVQKKQGPIRQCQTWLELAIDHRVETQNDLQQRKEEEETQEPRNVYLS